MFSGFQTDYEQVLFVSFYYFGNFLLIMQMLFMAHQCTEWL